MSLAPDAPVRGAGTTPAPVRPAEIGVFVGMAVALLAATLAWHVPMMLWDHLDLLPLREGWKLGTVGLLDLLDVHHGSHVHAPAYAVLLATTELSGGRPWLDCAVSWIALTGYAALFLGVTRKSLAANGAEAWRLAIIFFALFPGHLANLQWGWQVAVFISLGGVAVMILALTRRQLSWHLNIAALAAAALAALSFSTGIAALPVAACFILARDESSWARRIRLVAPWCVLMIVLLLHLRTGTALAQDAGPGVVPLARYVLNFLGAAVARFATDLSPVLALAALVAAAPLAWRLRGHRPAWPWLAWMMFAVIAANLVALGRAGPYGADHAFVTRYVSFSSTFWLGWFGLVAVWLQLPGRRGTWMRAVMIGLASVFVTMALLNVLHLAKNARAVATRANATAHEIRATYPDVREGLLREIYFDRPEVARQRLDQLHADRAAPFAGGG